MKILILPLFLCLGLVEGQSEERKKMAMCIRHDQSLRGKFWNEVQSEVFQNRFEEKADCDLGDPEAGFPFCNPEAEGVSAALSARQKRLYERRYKKLCRNGLPEDTEGCCIKKIDGKLMGVYGDATLPCLEERTIPGKSCPVLDWNTRKDCICRFLTGKATIPVCSVDSHCPTGQKCCWNKVGEACTMACV